MEPGSRGIIRVACHRNDEEKPCVLIRAISYEYRRYDMRQVYYMECQLSPKGKLTGVLGLSNGHQNPAAPWVGAGV